jgi:hypothetical protein
MSESSWIIVAIAGGVFLALGIGGLVWGLLEERHLFRQLAAQRDLREFSLKHVESPQPGALKMGGWILLALGIVLLAVGLSFWLTGKS